MVMAGHYSIPLRAVRWNFIDAPSSSRPAKEVEVELEITTGPNWLELPRDVTAKIFQKLGVLEIVTSASQVCSLWWNICKDPLMWRIIHMTFDLFCSHSTMVDFCLYAVERSCGHLEDISIEYFGTNNLLKYIADSTSQLRRMRLHKCWSISDKGWVKVAKKFPLLEELEISFCNLTENCLEVIGRCCPVLKSLKFNRGLFHSLPLLEVNGYDEAFVIAKSMPNLRYLQIVGNCLGNEGLHAILDGCPLLEFLDLRACFNVDFSGSLEKRCHEQIKDLRLPNDYEDLIFGDFSSSAIGNSDYGLEFGLGT